MLNIIIIAFFTVMPFFLTDEAEAVYNPLEVPNNIYGIHITDENDLENAAQLVNSSGGDWGYVTFVIREDDRFLDKWNKIFDRLAYYHLIPIVRIAGRPEGNNWAKPENDGPKQWSVFLNNLYWPVRNRYIVLFNEPNHAKEWGGEINPEEYTDYANSLIDSLKNVSEDFFVMLAGFDAAAGNSKDTMDMVYYLDRMYSRNPAIFLKINGWVSHSYPNPHFSGNPQNTGRTSINGYEWELNLLKKFTPYDLPVFITETGWLHNGITGKGYVSEEETARNFVYAFEHAWVNTRIAAVTPFILNYQSEPFWHFSWQKRENNGFYLQYETVRSLPKTQGQPLLNEPDLTVTPIKNQTQEKVKGMVSKKNPNLFNHILSVFKLW